MNHTWLYFRTICSGTWSSTSPQKSTEHSSPARTQEKQSLSFLLISSFLALSIDKKREQPLIRTLTLKKATCPGKCYCIRFGSFAWSKLAEKENVLHKFNNAIDRSLLLFYEKEVGHTCLGSRKIGYWREAYISVGEEIKHQQQTSLLQYQAHMRI